MRLIKKVEVIGIEKELMEKDDSIPGAYKLPFKLSEVPSNEWERIFDHAHTSLIHSRKRRAYIEGVNIIVLVAESDNLQTQADFIKSIVQETNKEVDRMNDNI